MSRPPSRASRWLIRTHFQHILPFLMRISTRNEPARLLLMKYYWDTIDRCVSPEAIMEALRHRGFIGVERRVLFGCLSEYVAAKPVR